MPTEALTIGDIHNLIQNVVYALPATKCLLYCSTVAATFQQSDTVTFTVNSPLALTAAGQAEVAGGFIRCTSAGPVGVYLKRDH